MRILALVDAVFRVYSFLILARVIMSWIRPPRYSPVYAEVDRLVGGLTDPYLNVFRRFIPPVGMIDFSPWVAIVALPFIQRLVILLLMPLL